MARRGWPLKRGGVDEAPPSRISPRGTLLHLSVNQIKPSADNPRRLFDAGPLRELRESIRQHGVLVPITVYSLPGQDRYAIVDGERRYRCCLELEQEGTPIPIPANVIDPPDAMASLIYMFNIHAFREQWELMPTALSLQGIMDGLGQRDTARLHEITGLSVSQIERCKKILSFPPEFRKLSLEPDEQKRIPSNFWVELHPVLEIARDLVPDLYSQLGRDGIASKMVDKYRRGSIRSVIHFRRILEAYEVATNEDTRSAVADSLREYVLTPDLETRAAFDGFIRDNREVQKSIDACNSFARVIRLARIEHAIERRDELIKKLEEVKKMVIEILDRLQGDDPNLVGFSEQDPNDDETGA